MEMITYYPTYYALDWVEILDKSLAKRNLTTIEAESLPKDIKGKVWKWSF